MLNSLERLEKRQSALIDRGAGSLLDVEQIRSVLPHRFPFLLVDRILELDPGRRAVGLKNVTINEGFFEGHFPGHAVMPGFLLFERWRRWAASCC